MEPDTPKWMQDMETAEQIRLFSNLYVKKTAKGAFCSAQEIDALFRIELGEANLSPLELSRQMGVSKPIVSRLLEHLTDKGLVEKIHSENDRRRYFLTLTQKGKDTLTGAYLYYVEPVKKLEQMLGTEKYRTLLGLITLATRD